MTTKAILFDFGGVLLSSPIDAFLAHERAAGLPRGFVQKLNTIDPDHNAWACMERGEIDADEFHRRFDAEARRSGHLLDSRALLSTITGTIRKEMVDVVVAAKKRYVVACVTNNMALGHGTAMAPTAALAAPIAEVMALFDHVVESCKIGMRKPERRFFERACAIVGVAPEECVYLDDLGTNLKPARVMGMRTIKVVDPLAAIEELEATLGHSLRR